MAQGKQALIAAADKDVAKIDGQYSQGLITDLERYKNVVRVWQKASESISDAMMDELTTTQGGRDPQFHPLLLMTRSGARGNKGNIGQLGAMRGLMADPSGRIIDVPVKSNFREGMTVLEYFISTHGARKGLADTALRTADSGYLTRRLVDVAQDVIVRIADCGTTESTEITLADTAEVTSAKWPVPTDSLDLGLLRADFAQRLVGRIAASEIKLKASYTIQRGETIDEAVAADIQVNTAIERVAVRSPLSCVAPTGVCQACYGRNPATGKLVEVGEAVGIVAAQSIGEPGTQLTMRTFHTGGVASVTRDVRVPVMDPEKSIVTHQIGKATVGGFVLLANGMIAAKSRNPAAKGSKQKKIEFLHRVPHSNLQDAEATGSNIYLQLAEDLSKANLFMILTSWRRLWFPIVQSLEQKNLCLGQRHCYSGVLMQI
jgi:hypothetical protein